MRYASLLAIVALSVALSCASPAAEPGRPGNADMQAFIGNAAVLGPGTPSTVMTRGEFAIVLEENASTGYQWTYTVTPTGLAAEIGKERFGAVAQPMVGAPVDTVWKFRADAEGEAVITFLYYRPWEKPETAVKREVFTVKIVR